MTDYRPLILTARMESRAFHHFQALRERHFPPERNQVPAHVTLFHHLPGAEVESIVDRLKSIARGTRAPRIEVAGLRSLGRGVAYDLRSPDLELLRAELAHAWQTLLIPQDRAGFRPHVTVQNKVEAREAKLLFATLSLEFEPWSFIADGLQLWRYLDGPWEPVSETRFRP
ncbi:MAG: 2'-5' RNA ligase family protein [Sphingomonadaceae bacterium]|nr:2'-5' RNA ligase family protein [Sphingomonadaceae bacterium]